MAEQESEMTQEQVDAAYHQKLAYWAREAVRERTSEKELPHNGILQRMEPVASYLISRSVERQEAIIVQEQAILTEQQQLLLEMKKTQHAMHLHSWALLIMTLAIVALTVVLVAKEMHWF